MFLEDRMFNTLPNLDSWLLSTFNQLNKYMKKRLNMGRRRIYLTKDEKQKDQRR